MLANVLKKNSTTDIFNNKFFCNKSASIAALDWKKAILEASENFLEIICKCTNGKKFKTASL